MKSTWSLILASLLIGAGCGGAESADDESDGAIGAAAQAVSGKNLFNSGKFGGNGRTCLTCHGEATGTFSLAEAQDRFDADPTDPLFRPIDSDDGTGASYHRLLDHGTVFVTIPLPTGVTLADDPSATSVRLERTIPSTLDRPALDPVLMWDGRAATLQDQALGAIRGHAQATETPSADNLTRIAEYEKTLFSSKQLKKYADGGPAPAMPEGITASEKRGRLFFLDIPFSPPSLHGFCASCHSGPLFDTTNQFNPVQPAGLRFSTALVSEVNLRNVAPRTFLFPVPGGVVPVPTPDPGRGLITGNIADANLFKIGTLWNIKNTAPYFHDGSAKTLEDVMVQYQIFAQTFTGLQFTPQETSDIIAYLKVL
ncbi:MAG: cytochrome c peroxidase [Byssovorax sp.]